MAFAGLLEPGERDQGRGQSVVRVVGQVWSQGDPYQFKKLPINGRRRLYSILLRAGAAVPADLNIITGDAYLLKVRAAGGFRAYERSHLNALAATFAAKLPLPPELVRRVVEYAFHVGDY